MKNKQKVITIILSLVLLLSVIAVTYSFFVTNVGDYNSSNFGGVTANIGITYTDCVMGYDHCQNVTAGSMRPGDSVEKTFQVKNTGNVPLSYTLTFENLVNTFQNSELVYKLENITNTNSVKILYEKRVVPYAETSISGKDLLFYDTVTVNSTNKYKMTITFVNSEYDQSYNMGATFTFNIGISGVKELDTLLVQSKSGTWYDPDVNNILGNSTKSRDLFDEITILDNKNVPNSVPSENIWDVSVKQQGEILAWYTESETEGMYHLYIGQDGGVVANPNSSALFARFINVTKINGIEKLNTSQMKNIEYMFQHCENLLNLDLTTFDTSNVTSLRSVFEYCYTLRNLNVSTWNTFKVKTLIFTFSDCRALMELNIKNWDVSNNNSLYFTFNRCSLLTNLDLSTWNTSNVTTMNSTFSGCERLTQLSINNFNTSLVTDMQWMFGECKRLSTLDLSKFNTSNVSNMYGMFYLDYRLKEIKFSNNFDTSKVTSMQYMFYYNSALSKLDISMFKTDALTNAEGMFYQMENIEEINMSSALFDKVTNYTDFITRNSKLTKVTIKSGASDFITARLTDAGILNNVTIVTV